MPTIADVAHAAGVSISTVSYVMSGKRTISQETKDRVADAIIRLGYSPHASARSLASRATNVIGLQAPLRAGVDVHVIMEIVAGIVREARSHRYDLLLLTGDDSDSLTRASRGSQVDALIVMDVSSDDDRIGALSELHSPSVLIGLPSGAEHLTCIDFDFEAAGRLAAERLAALGHTRIGLLGAPAEVLDRHTSYAERLARGFLSAANGLGITATTHACPSGAEAVGVVSALLEADPTMTGILLHNEGALPHVGPILLDAERAVIALAPSGLNPSTQGFVDGIEIPAEEMGAAATRAILGLLDGTAQARVQLLPPTLRSQAAAAYVAAAVPAPAPTPVLTTLDA